nr:uncharacterized protein LOC109180697 isoform X2 [Ipomoea trifida]
MGTRSNLYKNPSFVYNKSFNLNSVLQNLNAYNVVTGNVSTAPSTAKPDSDDNDIGHHKRRRTERRQPLRNNESEVKVNDKPMSHQDYIEERRKEIASSRPYEELSADVLETSTSVKQLVEYESSTNEDDRVKTWSEQRFPLPREPVCVVCGKYGEYICNETEDDICSIDCKAELLENLKPQQGPLSAQFPVEPFGNKCYLEVPESGGDIWNYENHRWSKKRSGLCAYECWKCQRPGHLPDDCLVMASANQSHPSGESGETRNQVLVSLYAVKLEKHQFQHNAILAVGLHLWPHALDVVIPFVTGHLSKHISAHPSHQQYYSYKLNRLVKCCKSTCKVTDIQDLLACHHCFNKAFDKYYDMYTATWKGAGLSIIWGSICCEDHFEWHRINCFNAGVEDSAYIIKKHSPNDNCALSDFIF